MPANAAMLPEFNKIFGPEYIGNLDPALFAPDANLLETVRQLQDDGIIHLNPTGLEFLGSVPSSLIAAVQAILYNAVERRLPVMFAWAPAYDFELNVWEATATDRTTGGVTIFVRSPYDKTASQTN